MRSIAEALRAMLPAFSAVGVEEVDLIEATGRFLALDVVASSDNPRLATSAMDGYAVRAADVVGATADSPIRLPIRGQSRAGGDIPGPLAPGTACRIFTGAAVPEGADAVVLQEDTVADDDDVVIAEASHRGRHVRAQGSDVKAGMTILRVGDRVDVGALGLLASQNISRVSVYTRPRVALLSTGDELRPLGEDLARGQIVNSNRYVVTEMIRAVGAIPVPFDAAPDDVSSIEETLRRALEADVVITMGGVSVGEFDLVHEAFARVGIDRRFWKVGIKPGKPLWFGDHEGTPVVGLPGNPISAMVTFEVLVAPCVRHMTGDPEPHPHPIEARLAHPYARRSGRVEIARARAWREGDEVHVTLNSLQGSGSLPSFVGVNALVIIPSERENLAAGDEVQTLLWGPGLRGSRSFFDRLD